MSATLWIAREEGGVDPETPLLGMTLLRRAVIVGQRAGFGRIIVEGATGREGRSEPPLRGVELVARGGEIPTVLPGRLVILSAGTVPEKTWLKELRQMPVEPGQVEVDPGCAAVLETEDPAAAVRALLGRGKESFIEAVARLLPNPPGHLSSSDRFVIGGPEDFATAERWMLARLVKEKESFMSRHVERRISLAISRRLAATRVTPNHMTLISVAVGIVGAALFLSTRPWAPLAGALLVLAHSILDGCDGELARLKFQESRLGGVLDFWGDNVVHSALFAAIAVAWARAAGETWPLLLGASAVLGTLLCAGFVYVQTMAHVREGPLFTSVTRAPDSAFSRLVDALGRRDFLYLVVILSAFHRERWFLAAAAVGSPIYFLLLVVLSRRGPARRADPGNPIRADNPRDDRQLGVAP